MENELKNFEDYLVIPESEMQFMASDSYAWGNCETGGALYGLFSRGGRPVIMLASPPGVGACHEVAHFAQNPDHLIQINQQLLEKYGIHYIGNWHSHHFLGLIHPSGDDTQQIHRVARKGNISRLIQIIITREEDHGGNSIMRINSFIYSDAANGFYYKRCGVKILTEPSPIRAMLGYSHILHLSQKHDFKSFGFDKIAYDPLVPVAPMPQPDHIDSAFLISQLEGLPEHVADQAIINLYEDSIVLSLPLGTGASMIIVYQRQENRHIISSVEFKWHRAKRSIDITSRVLQSDYSKPLNLVYEIVKSIYVQRSNARSLRATSKRIVIAGSNNIGGEKIFY